MRVLSEVKMKKEKTKEEKNYIDVDIKTIIGILENLPDLIDIQRLLHRQEARLEKMKEYNCDEEDLEISKEKIKSLKKLLKYYKKLNQKIK